MHQWKKVKLKDVCTKIGSGATPKGGKEAYLSEGISLIRSQNILDFCFSTNGLAFIDENQAKQLAGVTIYQDDVLLNITGDSVARVCKVPDYVLPARVNQHVAILRANDELLDANFLKYYLLNPVAKNLLLNLSSTGATRNALTKSMIEDFEIPLPPLTTQARIAEVLSSLDEKIELNRQTNQTLENIAKALFEEWFVSNNESFDRFESHFEVSRGLSYKGSGLTVENDGLPMHNLNSVYEGGGYKYEGIKYYNGEYRERHEVKPRDILVTNTEQGHKYLLIGFPAVVPYYFGKKGIFSQHIYRLRIKEESYLTPHFAYYLMLQPKIREQIIGCTNGTTVNMLSMDGLQKPEFSLPDEEKVKRFSVLVEDIWQKKEENHKESQTLTAMRDGLLPKLMSGAVAV